MKNVILLLLLFVALFSFSQTPTSVPCGTDLLWQQLQQEDPVTRDRQRAIDRQVMDILAHRGAARVGGVTTTHTIPVVVHIIHNGGLENISNVMVQQGIQDLNDAFANVGAYDPLTGVNTDIQFCLASQDPTGAGTTGIVRVQSPLTNVIMETEDLSLKNLSRWDPTKYLNIWLVAEINSLAMGYGVAGYAYFPSSHGQPKDGIVNEARWFGSSTDNSKTHVHEAGHYLGLYHTFDGGCTNGNCLADGDRVCDTPPDNSTAVVLCNSPINTCTTDDDDLSINNPFRPQGNGGLGDQPDMVMNYMDYGASTCQSAFTQGQKDRMILALTGTRASLLGSLGCLSPCVNTINCGFTPSATTVAAGTMVTFANTSTGATTFEWQRNGVTFSTATNPTWTPGVAGTYHIVLNASNADPSCSRSHSVPITVTCAENASFNASASNVNIGGSVTFTNTSTGPSTNFRWLMNGILASTATHFSPVFPTAGGYSVQLVQQGPACSDTTAGWYITVGQCQPKNGNYWYFGHLAGINFNGTNPVAINNSNSSFFASEPVATMSDNQGNLLFYTDGRKVYNKVHQPMVNGDNMGGEYSSSQGALAIPKPGSTTQYYLFTQAHFGGALNDGDGLYAALIDMTLAGGNGAVVWKRDTLMRPAAERLTAVNHCNGRDVWLINHEYGTDAYYAFLATPTGIQPPVVTHIGNVITGGWNNISVIGCMKASPDGKKIAAVSMSINPRLEIFDFDNATGILSNVQLITNNQLTDPYGVEFSPDGSRLYVTVAGEPQVSIAGLYQYNMLAGSPSAIAASQTQIAYNGTSWGALQLAPDGKIYMARYESTFGNNRLGRIDNPNTLGIGCNFNPNGFTLLSNGWSSIGLPLFNQSYFTTTTPEIAGPDTVCAYSQGIEFHRPPNNCSGGGTISYQVSGDAQIIASNDTMVTLSFGAPGTVVLTILETATCGSGADNMSITVIPSDSTLYLGPDIALCQGSTATLDAGPGYTAYLWSNGGTTQTITASAPGSYWCEVTGASQCRPRDSIQVLPTNIPLSLNLGPDQTICDGQVATLHAGPGYGSYLWQDGSTNQTLTAWLPGLYSVTVTGTLCTGTATDQVNVIHSQAVPFSLGADTVICESSTILLQGPPNVAWYAWSDQSSSATLAITQPGTYWLTATTADGCTHADTIVVSPCVGLPGAAAFSARIWPNPTEGALRVSLQLADAAGPLEVSLWDMAGRELLRVLPAVQGSNAQTVLDLEPIAAGMYFLRVKTGTGVQAFKVERRRD